MRTTLLFLILSIMTSFTLTGQGKLAVLNPHTNAANRAVSAQTAHASPHLILDNKSGLDVFVDIYCSRQDWSAPKVQTIRLANGAFHNFRIPHTKRPDAKGKYQFTEGIVYKLIVKSPQGERVIDLGHSPLKSIPIFTSNNFIGFYAWVALIDQQKNVKLCVRNSQGVSGQCTMIQ